MSEPERRDPAMMNEDGSVPAKSAWLGNALPCGALLAVYLLATWLTSPVTMGDTPVYASAIMRRLGGGSPSYWDQGGFESFWEFGHLLWRPLGWAFFRAARPLVSLYAGDDQRLGVTATLVALSWASGLLSVLLCYALARRVCRRALVAATVTLAFIFSNAFLNYAQAGCSYIPGLSLLLLGLYLLVRGGEEPVRSSKLSACAGVALGGAICMWFPYLWIVPGALAAPPLLFGFKERRLRFVLLAAVACALTVALLYGVAVASLGLFSLTELRAWVASSSHGVTRNGGVARVLFGIPRSLINMGNDSVFFKRFLAHDPYNPVSLADLFRLSLWKLAFAYLFLASLLIGLLQCRQGRRLLCLLTLSGAPLVLFAVLFAGGVLERYLPLFPALFLALAGCLAGKHCPRWSQVVAFLFMAVAATTNAAALSNLVLEREQEAVASRVRELQPALKPHSRLLVAPQDQLWGFAGTYPLHPVNRAGNLLVDPVAILGTADVPQWRAQTARAVLQVWQEGGDIWLSRRLLAVRPRAEWNWAEREDPGLGWSDMYNYFAPLETGETAGGADGFVRLLPSPANERYLSGFAASAVSINER